TPPPEPGRPSAASATAQRHPRESHRSWTLRSERRNPWLRWSRTGKVLPIDSWVSRSIGQYDGCFNLTMRNRTVGTKESIFLGRGHHLEPVLLVETNGPRRSSPRAHQHRLAR